MHKKLRQQLEQARSESGEATDLDRLLKLVDEFYCEQDKERLKAERTIQMISDNLADLGEEIRETRDNRLQAILDNVKDAIFTLNEDGSIRIFNPTGERIFGFSEDELRGRSLELLIPEARGRVEKFLTELAALSGTMTNDLMTCETQGKRKNGELFSAELAISETLLRKKKIYVGCLRDISQRKEIEKALRTSEARFRSLVENAPEAIVVLDNVKDAIFTLNEDGSIRIFNPTGERIFGFSEDELRGRSLELLIPEARGRVEKFLTELAALSGTMTNDLMTCETQGKRKNGELFSAELAISETLLRKKKIYVGCLRDISQRKEIEKALRTSEARFRSLVENAPADIAQAADIDFLLSQTTDGTSAQRKR